MEDPEQSVVGHSFANESTDTNNPRHWTVAAAVIAVVGLVLRILVLRSPMGRLDADEATVALMGRQVAAGHRPPLFFWGQFYGGTIEPSLVGISLKLFGDRIATATAVKLVPLSLSAFACWPFGLAARRIVGPQRAKIAAALLFAWPGTTWLATKERGFYWVGMLLVCSALLAALKLANREPNPNRSWLLFGAIAGLAWYNSAQCMYFIAPLAVWLVWTTRPQWRSLALGGFAAIIGASPWIYGAFEYGTKVVDQEPSKQSYLSRLNGVWSALVPRIFGVRHLFEAKWLFSGVGVALYVAITIALLVIASKAVRSKAVRDEIGAPTGRIDGVTSARLITVLAISLPLLAAVPSLSVFVSEPRYALYLAPTAVLVVVVVARKFRTSVAVATVILVCAVVSFNALHDVSRQPQQKFLDLGPSDTKSLELLLYQRHTTVFYADYWLAYPLTIRHAYGIVASPLDLPRIAEIEVGVDARRPTTWVLYKDSNRDYAIARLFNKIKVGYKRETVNEFAVFTLDRYVNPIDLPEFWRRHPPGR